MQDEIKARIEESHYLKYSGIAPDGFVLVPQPVLDLLANFEEWKDFKDNRLDWIAAKSKDLLMGRPIAKPRSNF